MPGVGVRRAILSLAYHTISCGSRCMVPSLFFFVALFWNLFRQNVRGYEIYA